MECRAGKSVKSRSWWNRAAVACVSMTVLREFSLPGRESEGLLLTLVTVKLAQDGGQLQVKAEGMEVKEVKQALCHMPAAFYLLVTRQQERADKNNRTSEKCLL